MKERRELAGPKSERIAGTIPALIWRGQGQEQRPAVIYLGGGGGRKEDVPDWIVDAVTSAGITLLSFDLPHHGERVGAAWVPPQRVEVKDFVEFVQATVDDLRAVVGYLRQDPDTDGTRIGIRAISLSATCALAAIAAGISVQGMLSICGSADYAQATAFRLQREGLPVEDIEREIDELALLPSPLDPLRHVSAFSRCPLFMIHGLADLSVPLESHRALFEAVAPYYINRPGQCIFLTHPGKHGIRRPLEEIGMRWLIDCLGRT